MNRLHRLWLLKSYRNDGFSLVPAKPRSKIPMVKWKEYRLTNKDFLHFLAQDANWAIRCDDNFHAFDFDDAEVYVRFMQEKGKLLKNAPVIRTGRGYHVWFKPKRPVNTFSVDSVEVKGLGSLVVVPPSIHPSGVAYQFEKPQTGKLPEVDLEEVFGPGVLSRSKHQQSAAENAPSDFALRYGKSPYPQCLCGRATKILTRSDGKVKHLVSLRCWKWDCPKCAPLLKRYWLGKLRNISFRFILWLPSQVKPTAFLRRVGKPDYAHIVANGESWLFIAGGDADRVWMEAERAGYEVKAGDATSYPAPEEVVKYLEQALCQEKKPLNTRRKITHSRGLFNSSSPNNRNNESKRNPQSSGGDEHMSAMSGEERPTWESAVVMKPIEEIAKELESQGWRILWKSEVEAIAVRDTGKDGEHLDIVDLIESLGVKLKKVGSEYMGLCPFHDDRKPSLSVNRDKGLWHCFGCERSGDARKFIEEWECRGKRD